MHTPPPSTAAYRPNDREAYLALWNDLDRNSGIVEATVCGRDNPLRVLQSFNATRHSSDFRIANFLSTRACPEDRDTHRRRREHSHPSCLPHHGAPSRE